MRLHGGNIEEIGLKGLDFSCNLNPFAPPDEVTKLLSSLDPELFFKHPPIYPEDLEKELAEVLGVPYSRLCLLPGSIYGVHAVLSLKIFKRAVVPVPTFNEYERLARIFSIQVKRHILREEMAFKLCLGELASDIEERDVVFVCNPNNPTGHFFSVDEIKGLLRWCALKDAFVVFDEAFIDFTEHAQETLEACLDSDRALILRSFTKIFSIPGIRLGYAVGPEGVIALIRELVPSWGITTLAVRVGRELIKHLGDIKGWRREIAYLRGQLAVSLESIGLKVFPSSANYLFVKSPKRPASSIYNKLKEKGILVRIFPEYEDVLGDYFFRICVRSFEENQALLEALKEVV